MTLHSGLRRTSYEAMFGSASKVGLSTSPIPRQMFDAASLGTSIHIPVPKVDRKRGDAASTLDVVMENTGEGFLRLGTRDERIKQLYSRSQLNRGATENNWAPSQGRGYILFEDYLLHYIRDHL
ncbi:hypothetical protein TNCV_56911 [Trichonephila clavipes]|nr:hypothetical protein TNCV_56911 [Trichonephila clavipes]